MQLMIDKHSRYEPFENINGFKSDVRVCVYVECGFEYDAAHFNGVKVKMEMKEEK